MIQSVPSSYVDRAALKAAELLGPIKPLYPLDMATGRILSDEENNSLTFPFAFEVQYSARPSCGHLTPFCTPVPIPRIEVFLVFQDELLDIVTDYPTFFVIENPDGVTVLDFEAAYENFRRDHLQAILTSYESELLEVSMEGTSLSDWMDNDILFDVISNSDSTTKWPFGVVSGGKMVLELFNDFFRSEDYGSVGQISEWGDDSDGYYDTDSYMSD